jgi:hypothetical protein
MAFAGNWQVAALLILAERIGRAIRKPTVEAMLSYTTGKHGKGWVYAVSTALDETGDARPADHGAGPFCCTGTTGPDAPDTRVFGPW